MEPSVSSVPSSVWAYLKRKLEKVLFLQAYQISHESYLKHKHRKWYEHLVQGIEYDVYLENSRLSNQEVPMSKLYLKVDKNQPYQKLIGHFIAKSGSLVYQNSIDLLIEPDSSTPTVYVCNLPNIPLKDLYIDQDGIFPSIRETEFVGTVIGGKGNTESFKVRSNLPLYEEFMNDDWDRKWGHVWCITFLNQEFENFRFKYIGRLAGPFALLDLGKRPNEPKVAKLRRYWCSFVVNFICNEKLLKMLWWTTMKLRVKSLKQAANPE